MLAGNTNSNASVSSPAELRRHPAVPTGNDSSMNSISKRSSVPIDSVSREPFSPAHTTTCRIPWSARWHKSRSKTGFPITGHIAVVRRDAKGHRPKSRLPTRITAWIGRSRKDCLSVISAVIAQTKEFRDSFSLR